MDTEKNRLSGRLSRYAQVGTNVGGIAAKMAGSRLFSTSFQILAKFARARL